MLVHQCVVFAICAGFAGPVCLLILQAKDRMNRIEGRLPEFIDLLTACIEAGLGFELALKRVCDRFPGPLSEEFQRALNEIRMGMPRSVALQSAARKTGVEQVLTLISALIQADQLGVSIGKTLRAQGNLMREKRKQKARELAMKAPVKMLFPLVFFIFPAIFSVILGPAVILVMNSLRVLP